jgi:transcriptional regulator with XRE-family HTH domain
MEFKEQIKKLRKSKDLTHTQLASILDKSEAAIRAWESGRTKPDADTIIRISEYFQCSTDFLLGLSDSRNKAHSLETVNAASSTVDRINNLHASEKAYVLDITDQILTCLEEFKDNENAREIFLTCFFKLFMDLRLCVSNIANYLANESTGELLQNDAAAIELNNIRDIADMDYKTLWESLGCLINDRTVKTDGHQQILTES